jgi:uncharacterized membrane protein
MNQAGSGLARINIGTAERLASGCVGGVAALYGIRHRSIPGLVLAAAGAALVHRAFTGHCSVHESLNVDTARAEPPRPEEYFARGIHVEHAITINKPPGEIYQYWRDLTNLPKIMSFLESVTLQDDKRSHWVAKAPAGTRVEWDAEIINDEPDKLIAWKSLADAAVANAGSVRFLPAPGDRGTELRITLDYLPPGGKIAAAVAKLFGRAPRQEIVEDLRRFKQFMETGEVPTTQGQSTGTGKF